MYNDLDDDDKGGSRGKLMRQAILSLEEYMKRAEELEWYLMEGIKN